MKITRIIFWTLNMATVAARVCSRSIKLAGTIADMYGQEDIHVEHIAEAAGYRFVDKQRIEW